MNWKDLTRDEQVKLLRGKSNRLLLIERKFYTIAAELRKLEVESREWELKDPPQKAAVSSLNPLEMQNRIIKMRAELDKLLTCFGR